MAKRLESPEFQAFWLKSTFKLNCASQKGAGCCTSRRNSASAGASTVRDYEPVTRSPISSLIALRMLSTDDHDIR